MHTQLIFVVLTIGFVAPYVVAIETNMTDEEAVFGLEMRRQMADLGKKMKNIFETTSSKFENVEKELERRRQNFKTTLMQKFQSIMSTMPISQFKEMQQAKKEGKADNVNKIGSCVLKEQRQFNKDLMTEYQKTTKCINDVTQKAKDTIKKDSESFKKTVLTASKEVKTLLDNLSTCIWLKTDSTCLPKDTNVMKQKVKETEEESMQQFNKIKEVDEKQNKKMAFCNGNFWDNVKTIHDNHAKIIDNCVKNP